MDEIILNDVIIEKVKKETTEMIKAVMGEDLIKVVLYGSCARGDYTQDSDIDIALITACDRLESKKYNDKIAEISMRLAMKYFSVVNFVCLPYAEFIQKKSWYLYFRNIDLEGEVLYG
ncbi:MAG: nucleotidyltransferase domain-containing protein [Lachnospiraceae bacterium]|nr:nucleotidyltransferase domain-containing protein [Lachnospiraceae bacterium]